MAVVLLLVGRGLVPAVLTGGASSAGSAEPVTTTAVVQPGQTLWDLASATGSADTAGTVAEIAELNGLRSSTVWPGQRLLVPAY